MSNEIKVPVLPESVADALIAKWHKKPGDPVARNEVVVELETDKVMLEVPSLVDGVMGEILHAEGEEVTSDTVLATVNEGGAAAVADSNTAKASEDSGEAASVEADQSSTEKNTDEHLTPAIRRLLSEHDLQANQIIGTGKGGRITKQDVLQVIKNGGQPAAAKKESDSKPAAAKSPSSATTSAASESSESIAPVGERAEERVPMTRLRKRIAERLVNVQQTAALLTTFNEVNMQAVMDLRKQYKDSFEKTHGVRLGFMSFFIKACVEALKRFPSVNASLDGDDIVYHHYFDIGVAVGGGKGGLVVPVLRNVENLGMADIEKTVRQYGGKAKEGRLTLDDMTGGTFTVTNGGIYGSMMSTPIINPPQSAILGMHNIVERPVAENGQVVIRPMMYIALTYDHRIIDGKDAVSFLVAIKQLIEDPARLLLAI